MENQDEKQALPAGIAEQSNGVCPQRVVEKTLKAAKG